MSATSHHAATPVDETGVAAFDALSRQPAVVTRDLRKEYGGRTVVHDLSLSVAQGEVFGFLGPNGAGKTTTVKILLGLVKQTAGDALICGVPASRPEARRRVGYLPENFRFHDWLSGEDLLDFHGRLAGLSADERRARIPQVIERVGLAGRGRDRIRGYSKGMTQRIGIAQAILHRPSVIFLDEPTSALDPIGRREVRDLIRELRDEGMTVFLNSHLLSEVEMVCDRVAIVDRGRVVREGRLSELVAGHPEIEITVDRVDPALVAALAPLGGLVTSTERSLTLTLDHLDRVPLVVDAIAACGRRLYALVPRQRSLEDLFVSLVERSSE